MIFKLKSVNSILLKAINKMLKPTATIRSGSFGSSENVMSAAAPDVEAFEEDLPNTRFNYGLKKTQAHPYR